MQKINKKIKEYLDGERQAVVDWLCYLASNPEQREFVRKMDMMGVDMDVLINLVERTQKCGMYIH